MTPETPTARRLADSLEASLIVRSGGAREAHSHLRNMSLNIDSPARTKVFKSNTSIPLNEGNPFIASAESHTSTRGIFAAKSHTGMAGAESYTSMHGTFAEESHTSMRIFGMFLTVAPSKILLTYNVHSIQLQVEWVVHQAVGLMGPCRRHLSPPLRRGYALFQNHIIMPNCQ